MLIMIRKGKLTYDLTPDDIILKLSGTQSPEVIKIKVQHSGSSDSSPAEQRKQTSKPEVRQSKPDIKSSKVSEPVSNKREQTLPNPEPDVNRSKSPRINPSRGVGKTLFLPNCYVILLRNYHKSLRNYG